MNVFVHFPTIYCNSGMHVSIQASGGHYCEPRMDETERYEMVELGYPSIIPPEYIQEYCENRCFSDSPNYLDSVYGWVPIELVERWIEEEGGIDLGRTIAEWNKVISGKILTNFTRR